jgi:hypothetical protein
LPAVKRILTRDESPLAAGSELTVFAQRKGGANGKTLSRHELGAAVTPSAITGLKPGADYRVYAVVTEGPYATAKKVSTSVEAEATAGA